MEHDSIFSFNGDSLCEVKQFRVHRRKILSRFEWNCGEIFAPEAELKRNEWIFRNRVPISRQVQYFSTIPSFVFKK